nr:hypothetical protein [Bacteroidota bacterium]
METKLNIETRVIENAHIFLWLIKDMCWVSEYKTIGMIMVFPTIATAIYITWLNRNMATELVHNLAVCCWISANSIWMIGEFFYNDTTRSFAKIFFIAGLSILVLYYVFHFLKSKISV